MGAIAVDDIIVTSLSEVSVEGGNVMHAMKCTDVGFVGFGEAYFSKIDMTAIKAWKKHINMTLNLIVPFGTVRFVFVDDKGGVREEVVGDKKYARTLRPHSDVWFIKKATSRRGGVEKWSDALIVEGLNTKFNDGTICFNKRKSKMYIKQCNGERGKQPKCK